MDFKQLLAASAATLFLSACGNAGLGANASGAGLGAAGGGEYSVGYEKISEACGGDSACINKVLAASSGYGQGGGYGGGYGQGGGLPWVDGVNVDSSSICQGDPECIAMSNSMLNEINRLLGKNKKPSIQQPETNPIRAKIAAIKACAKNDSTEISKSNCFAGPMYGVLRGEDLQKTDTPCSINYSSPIGGSAEGLFSSIAINNVNEVSVAAASYKIQDVKNSSYKPTATFENADSTIQVIYYLGVSIDSYRIEVEVSKRGGEHKTLQGTGICVITRFE